MATTTSISALPLDVLKQITFLVDDPRTTMPLSKQFLQASEFFYTKLFKEYSAEGSALHALDYPQRAEREVQIAASFTVGDTTYQWLDLARVQHVYRAVLSDARAIGGGDQMIIAARQASTVRLPNGSTLRQSIDPCKLRALVNWIDWEKDYNLILWFFYSGVGPRPISIFSVFWNGPGIAELKGKLANSTADFAAFVDGETELPEHRLIASSLAGQMRNHIRGNLDAYRSQLTSYYQFRRVHRFRDDNDSLHLIPEEIGYMTELEYLHFDTNNFVTIPKAILNLPKLKGLILWNCHLRSIPEEINQLTNLRTLGLPRNALTTLPTTVLDLPNLSRLDLYSNNLTDLPPMYRLENLEYLDLENNPIEALPDFPPNATLSYKTSLFTFALLKLLTAVNWKSTAIEAGFGENPWAGIVITLRILMATPFFIATLPLSIIEGVFRGIVGLIAQSIYLFLPQGAVRNFFTRDLLPRTWGSFGFCFRFLIVDLCLFVQNFYKSELNLKETEKLVKSYIPFL